MRIKSTIKKILGRENTKRIKVHIGRLRFFRDSIYKSVGKIISDYSYDVFQEEGYHLFFGYYDIQQIGDGGDKLLTHKLKEGSVVGQSEIIIAYIDSSTGIIHEITESSSWSWQQGSRLRWHPRQKDCILFNDFDGESYCTEVWNIIEKRKIAQIPFALYDISCDGRYGLSLNFSRLERLRPGYGYSNLSDESVDDHAPADDGIYYVDLEKKEGKMIIDLRTLARENYVGDDCDCYFNHISISPDSSRFIFFFLWKKHNAEDWKNCLYLMDIDTQKRVCLDNEVIVSHYCWKNNKELIYTSIDGGYYLMDVDNCRRYIIKNELISHDGHPTWLEKRKMIVSDTYPLKHDYQRLYMFSCIDNTIIDIAKLYSDPRLFDDKRCDLHPRVSPQGDKIIVDSTCRGGRRCIVSFEI